jgi:bacterioferritin (cytochrome b1)
MIVELNLSNIIFLAIASIGGLWALMKVIALQYRNDIKRELGEHFRVQDITSTAQYDKLNARLDTLDAAAKLDTGQWQRVERELLTLKADLPLHYVRREDYIRGQSTLEAKVDGVGMKLENALLRASAARPTL